MIRRNLLTLALTLMLAGCVRSTDDPDKVAHEFADALIGGQPGTAMLFTPAKDRVDESFRSAMASNSEKLGPCKEEKHDYNTTIVNDSKRIYRVGFGNLCGSGGLFYRELDIQMEKVDGRWLVVSYAPQVHFFD